MPETNPPMSANALIALTIFEMGLRLVASLKDDEISPEQLAEIKARADVSDERFDALVAKLLAKQQNE